MKQNRRAFLRAAALALLGAGGATLTQAVRNTSPANAAELFKIFLPAVRGGSDPVPTPTTPPVATTPTVPQPGTTPKLVFIHHSTGENWLKDSDGRLGIALRDAGIYVSDTNYGWGPVVKTVEAENPVGDLTDIGHWYEWFLSPDHVGVMDAVYKHDEHLSNYEYSTDPGGENEVVMFKSCYPNSNILGSPGDAPLPAGTPNPIYNRAQPSGQTQSYTVSNIKGLYRDLLGYFGSRTDKLFVLVTAPPLESGATDSSRAANARAVNNWLYSSWLAGYQHKNVRVFDFFNILTSNGGDPNTNDLGSSTGNHHRILDGNEQHSTGLANDFSSYPRGSGDSHPSTAGNLKATAEFVPLLIRFINEWRATRTT